MKKMFFVSALAVGLLAACSNDDVVSSAPEGNVPETGLMPVKLAMGQPMNIVTRGIGTVGDMASDAVHNVWHGETLYINMYMKTTAEGEATLVHSWWENAADISDIDDPEDILNYANEPVVMNPSAERGDSCFIESEGKYYPNDASRHEFFAYHIDDAATNLDENEKPVINDEMGEGGLPVLRKSVDFTINGSQDLMVGQATNDVSEETYSQKSARDGIVPRITMQHLLTRFQFKVVAGDETADGLEVLQVSVVSRSTGRMLIAWHPDVAPAPGESKIIWDEEVALDTLDLKQRPTDEEGQPQYLAPLEDMDPVTLTWNAEPDAEQDSIPVGEALMVQPDQTEYTVRVITKQTMDDGKVNIYPAKGTIRIPTGAARPGTSYMVTVALYGLQEIKISTVLTGWEKGDDIFVDTGE